MLTTYKCKTYKWLSIASWEICKRIFARQEQYVCYSGYTGNQNECCFVFSMRGNVSAVSKLGLGAIIKRRVFEVIFFQLTGCLNVASLTEADRIDPSRNINKFIMACCDCVNVIRDNIIHPFK